jgi:hypothetical protein
MVITNLSVSLHRSIYSRKAASKSSLAMMGATPCKVPWGIKQLARSEFRRRKKDR